MSILEVAKVAGVSHTTVARVVNNHPGVSVATAERVRQVMKKIGYKPPDPGQRRGPRTRARRGIRCGNIAMLLLGRDTATVMRQPILPEVLHGVENALASEGLNMLLSQIGPDCKFPPAMAAKNIDGLILMGDDKLEQNATIRKRLQQYPAVWMLSRHGEFWGDSVGPDNTRIGEEAARYLMSRGCQRPVFLDANPKHPAFTARGKVFCECLENAGLPVEMLLAETASGYRMTDSLYNFTETTLESLAERLRCLSPRPDGLFVPMDSQMAMLYPLLQSRGIQPGRDICVISCDNEPHALAGLHPRPATFDIRSNLIGHTAVQMLLWRMRNPSEPGRIQNLIKPVLVSPENTDDGLGTFQE